MQSRDEHLFEAQRKNRENKKRKLIYTIAGVVLAALSPVVSLAEFQQAKKEIEEVFVHKSVVEYMVEIVSATRQGENILMGVSPRGTLALLHCAKAYAYLQGRTFVIPDDIKALAVPVLSHRIVMGYDKSNSSKDFVEQILASTVVPTEDFGV